MIATDNETQERIRDLIAMLFCSSYPPVWVYYRTPKGWVQQYPGHFPEPYPNAAHNVVYNHAVKAGIITVKDYYDDREGIGRWRWEYKGNGSVKVAGHTFHIEGIPAGRDEEGNVISSGDLIIRPDPSTILDRYVVSVFRVFDGGYVYRFDPIRHI